MENVQGRQCEGIWKESKKEKNKIKKWRVSKSEKSYKDVR
jgi:hypothetical protein